MDPQDGVSTVQISLCLSCRLVEIPQPTAGMADAESAHVSVSVCDIQ